MNYKAYVFDLDDTLIDTKVRHYKLLSDYLKQHRASICSFKEYNKLREEKNYKNAYIADMFLRSENDFSSFWTLNVESEKYLAYDTELVNFKLLEDFKNKMQGQFILLSLRSNKHTSEKQFHNFRCSSLFEEVYFTAHHAINPKIEILSTIAAKHGNTCFVGDALTDAEASRSAGVDFFGVATGIHKYKIKSHFKNINHFLLNHELI